MPRAYDPSMPGGGIPVSHSPLNRVRYNVIPQKLDLQHIIDSMAEQQEDYYRTTLAPLIKAWTGIDISSWEAFFASLFGGTGVNLNNVLETGDPIDSNWLYNLIHPDRIGQVPASAIGDAVTNLLTDPYFVDATVVEGWVHDPHGGYGGTGSRTVTADGTTQEWASNPIPVSEDQVLPITGRVKWTDLAGTGEPIALGITGYLNGSATVQENVDVHNTVPAVTDWIIFSGNYVVPANVDTLRVRLIVSAEATAGTVSFSTMSATKTGFILQRLIAGTDTGDILTDDISNLFSGIISNALELLNKAGLADFQHLISVIAGDFGDAIEDAEARMDTLLDFSSPLNGSNIDSGLIADQWVPGVGSINDNLVTRLLGLSGSLYTHEDAASALESTTHALVDASSRIAQLELTFTGGVSEGDDFERTGTDLGPGWQVFYSASGLGFDGTIGTPDGHDAIWQQSTGLLDREYIALRATGTTRSATDLQRVGMVLSTRAGDIGFGLVGHNDLWLRVSDDTTSFANITGIRIRYGGDGQIRIHRFLNGVGTLLNEVPPYVLIPPGPGASLVGLAGEPGTARVFRAYIGVSERLEIVEVGTASGVGAGFRRWGFGGFANGTLLGQVPPARMHQWTGMDQVT